MTEKQFIEKNKEDWKRLESMIRNQESDADQMHQLFLKISGDLSYAQTYFPRRSIRWYLDSLLGSIYNTMRTNIKVNFFQSIGKFYSHTLPSEVIRNKNAFIASFVIFIVSALIGVYSTIKDPSYPNRILGDDYIEMTERNIKKGDAMAVYKSGGRLESYLYITNNNLKVAFNTYVLGLLGGIGTVFILIKNGVMVGAFQTFFFNKKLLLDSASTIWIHGTIEILSIIIAGAAGLIIGRYLLFPQSYTRIQSLMIGAVRSMIVMLSTFPLFIIAGFFEGFITPMTNLPPSIKIAFILASLLFMAMIFIVQPLRLYNKGLYNKYELPIQFADINFDQLDNMENNNYIKKSITFFRLYIGDLLKFIIIPCSLVYFTFFYFYIPIRNSTFNNIDFVKPITLKNDSFMLLVIDCLFIFYFFSAMKYLLNKREQAFENTIISIIKNHFGVIAIATLIVMIIRYYSPFANFEILFFMLCPYSILTYMVTKSNKSEADIVVVKNAFRFNFTHWLAIVPNALVIGFSIYFIYGTFTLLKYFIGDILQWHFTELSIDDSTMIINICLDKLSMILISIAIFLMYHYNLESILVKKFSYDIAPKIEKFILNNKV